MKTTRKTLPAEANLVHQGEKQREKALFWSFISAVAPVVPKVIAAVLSGSVTLYASTLKTFNEAVATMIAWFIARKMARNEPGAYDYGMGKLETIAQVTTGVLMFISILILVAAAVYRIILPEPLRAGGVVFGIVLHVIITGTNIYSWVVNYRIALLEPSPLMESQWRLFRLKALANTLVVFAMVLAVFCAGRPWAMYIDPVASFLVIILLLQSGIQMISASLPDLLDRTLEEDLQFVILKELTEYFDDYEDLHGIRSRRSGGNIYVEIFLEFNGNLQMSDVQVTINRMKSSMESKIAKCSVNIVPTSTKAS